MSSKKEEERNEKIIRGLMKLPPNRRCINCNSLGPQYVCTNFWTFVCMTCSGIHREFTHRVKSVSMAKFTSKEVEALQKGGNQRAREIYLKDWDLQRQRLPDSSNVDKIREFIKNVYVDCKYAGGRTSDKSPPDMQSLRNQEDDTRRASSYHSYSQSPPYEYQYEERRYGRQAGALTRKPGSDRALYEGKVSSFIYSPGRYEDRFANESTGSRISDYSVSSGGDPFRSDTQSPNFQKNVGFGSPTIQPVRNILNEDVQRQTMRSYSETNARRELNGVPRPQRTTSAGSFGSFDSNSMSLKSVNSGSFSDVISEPEHSVGSQQNKTHSFASIPRSSVSANTTSADPVNASFVRPPATSSTPSLDLFQSLGTSQTPSINLLQQPAPSSAPSMDLFGPNQTSSAQSLDLFANIAHQQPTTNILEQKQSGFPIAENEGWATFDSPQQVTSTIETKNVGLPAVSHADGLPVGGVDALVSTNMIAKMQSVHSSAVHGSVSPASSKCNGPLQDVQISTGPTSTKSWNAFEDAGQTKSHSYFGSLPPSIEPQSHAITGSMITQTWNAFEDSAGSISQTSFGNPQQRNEPQVQASSGPTSAQPWNAFEDSGAIFSRATFENLPRMNETLLLAHKPPATTDQFSSSKFQEESSKDGFQRATVVERAPLPSVPVNGAVAASSFTPSVLPLVGGLPSIGADRKSTNPFDLPYDSDLEPNNMFLDMSSLQATLPNSQLPPAFLGSLNQPWFPQNPVMPYPAAPQGGLAYMAGQAPSSQLPNIPSQGPVTPLGGNPFA